MARLRKEAWHRLESTKGTVDRIKVAYEILKDPNLSPPVTKVCPGFALQQEETARHAIPRPIPYLFTILCSQMQKIWFLFVSLIPAAAIVIGGLAIR